MDEATAPCTCASCISACRTKPGWFLPGEAERVADYLGISLQELFETRLSVDWYASIAQKEGVPENAQENAFVLAPAIRTGAPGTEMGMNPTGVCTFLTHEGRCAIHPVKPYECRTADHTSKSEDIRKRHLETAVAWLPHQDQIAALLGRTPQLPGISLFDVYSMLIDSFEGIFALSEDDDDEEAEEEEDLKAGG